MAPQDTFIDEEEDTWYAPPILCHQAALAIPSPWAVDIFFDVTYR
jgi:hypothetical protein